MDINYDKNLILMSSMIKWTKTEATKTTTHEWTSNSKLSSLVIYRIEIWRAWALRV